MKGVRYPLLLRFKTWKTRFTVSELQGIAVYLTEAKGGKGRKDTDVREGFSGGGAIPVHTGADGQ